MEPQLGFTYDEVRQLAAEAIQAIRLLWEEEQASFTGQYYQVEKAVCSPKPMQKPHPPIWVGGMKEQILRVAARFGDGVNFPDFFLDALAYRRVLEVLRRQCERVGRTYESVRKSHCTYTIVGRRSSDVNEIARELAATRSLTVDEFFAKRRGGLIGTVEEAVRRIREYAMLGAEHIIFLFLHRHEARILRLVGEEVLPAFQ